MRLDVNSSDKKDGRADVSAPDGRPTMAEKSPEVGSETATIFLIFMEMSEEGVTNERPSSYDKQQSYDGLEFGTDIESDGMSPLIKREEMGPVVKSTCDTARDEADCRSRAAEAESASSAAAGQMENERLIQAARELREIGDDINKTFIKNNPLVEQSLEDISRQAMAEGMNRIFEKSLEYVLDDFGSSCPCPDDKYKVALVMLCAQRVVGALKKSMQITQKTNDKVVRTAMSYIDDHFPHWLSQFSS